MFDLIRMYHIGYKKGIVTGSIRNKIYVQFEVIRVSCLSLTGVEGKEKQDFPLF
jgi:hypothetical protein